MCPTCKYLVDPEVVERVPAFPKADPPLPKRVMVYCPRDGCPFPFYVVDLDVGDFN